MVLFARFLAAFTLLVLTSYGGKAIAEAKIESQKITRVHSAVPVVRDIDYVLSALGSLESLHSPTVSAETSGRITRIDTETGTGAASGELLATIDNTLHKIRVAEAQAELKRRQVMLDNQRKEVQRLGRLAKSQSVSKDQLEDQQDQLAILEAQLEVAQKREEHARHMESLTRVIAPRAGAIARRYVSVGDYVTMGQPLFDLVTVDRLRARLSFPEQDASSIKIGQDVLLSTPAAPNVLASGTVTQINPRISMANRAIEVLVEFDNPGGWYPGGSVNATLVFARSTSALTVPRLSVVTRNGANVVFVLSGDSVYAHRVELGWQEPEWVEIIQGIEGGDRIIVEGAAQLSDGSTVLEDESIR